MDDSEFQRMPNPFSPFAQEHAHRRRNLFSSVKLLLAAVALFAVATASQAYLHRARLTELVGEFSRGSKAEKFERLEQLRSSGAEGIAGLVAALGDQDADVAEQAFGILMEAGPRWGTLPLDQRRGYQATFAAALLQLAETMDRDKEMDRDNDPKTERVQTLARQAISQWLAVDPASPDDDRHQVIRKMLAEVLQHGQSAALAQRDAETLEQGPLPIEWADGDAASWTDWPPTPLAPKLYRRTVATLDVTDQPAVVLSQFEEPAADVGRQPTRPSDDQPAAEARIVKPSYQPADSLREQPLRVPGGTTETADYWVAQLDSPSRNVRLRAVTELARRGDAACRRALREHLAGEPDHGVAFRIRKVLDESASPR